MGDTLTVIDSSSLNSAILATSGALSSDPI